MNDSKAKLGKMAVLLGGQVSFERKIMENLPMGGSFAPREINPTQNSINTGKLLNKHYADCCDHNSVSSNPIGAWGPGHDNCIANLTTTLKPGAMNLCNCPDSD